MAEVHDYDLHNYQKKLAEDDEKALKDKTYECTNYNESNCCGAAFLYANRDMHETDVCSKCLEHADVACQDCEEKEECNNPNMVY